MKKVIALGDVNLDVVLHLPEFPREGSDYAADPVTYHTGGSAANTCMALANLAVPVAMISRVGRDPFSQVVLTELRGAGVDVNWVQVDEHRVAGVMVVAVAPGGEKTMMGGRGANPFLDAESLPEPEIRSASLLHVSGYCFLEEPQRSAALRAMQIARDEAVPVSFDPGLNPVLRAREHVLRGLELSDLVFANAPEATELTGERDLSQALAGLANLELEPEINALRLRRIQPRTVAIKLGGEGCLVGSRKFVARIPAFPVTPVDTTGAGDAWNAGFLAGYLAGESLRVCGVLANAAAASAVEKVGTGAGMVTPSRVAEILSQSTVDRELAAEMARAREVLKQRG